MDIFHARLSPQNSLSTAGAKILLLGFSGCGLFISIGFIFLGAWPVFGFMAADIVLLCFVLRLILEKSYYVEEITISNHNIKIRFFNGKTCRKTVSFNPYWTMVDLSLSRNQKSILCFRSHGQFTEIAEFMCLKDKRQLAEKLESCIRSIKNTAPT
jgi:uncharacterized membrane protein